MDSRNVADIEMAHPVGSKDPDLSHVDGLRRSLRKLKMDQNVLEDSGAQLVKSLEDWKSAQPEASEDSGAPTSGHNSSVFGPVTPQSSVINRNIPGGLQNVRLYYESDGIQTPVKTYREGDSGIGFGFTDDGRVLISKSTNPSKSASRDFSVSSSQITVGHEKGHSTENSGQFVQQSSDLVQIVPKIMRDGSHMDLLQKMFNKKISDSVGFSDIAKALKTSGEANGVKLEYKILEELVFLIMDECDYDNDGLIQIRDLAFLLYGANSSQGTPDSEAAVSKPSVFKCDSDPEKFSGGKNEKYDISESCYCDCLQGIMFSRRFRQRLMFFALNNLKLVIAMSGWMLLNVALFVIRFYQMKQTAEYQLLGDYLCIAKAGAILVKFNTAILLFSVCRWTNTFLRGTALRFLVPFDEGVTFHKVAAAVIVLGSAIHTVPLVWGSYLRITLAPTDQFNTILGPLYNFQQPTYLQLLQSFNSVSGYLLWIILFLLYVVSPNQNREFLKKYTLTRAMGGFEAFWWTHFVFFPAFILLIIFHGTHSPLNCFPTTDTWIYISGPLLVYIFEKINRSFASRLSRQSMDVFQVKILPGKVLCLHFSNRAFTFRSGMYVFIKCPKVSQFEWHPFSITSAPSDFELTVHIRAVGDWTNAMFEFWKNEVEAAQKYGKVTSDGKIMVSIGPAAFLTRFRYPRVNVDGPHGSPTQEYDGYRVIMLVGAGIGVTPIASVVRDVLHKTENRQKYPEFRVEKVHFFWTTREQESFEWFSNIMTQAAEEDTEGIVDMHNYLTSAYGDDDPRSFLLKAAKDRFHARTGHDIITNTKTKVATHFARPDWNEIFKAIAKRSPDTVVGVFFCGPRALQVELQANCKKHSMRADNGATFAFHTENF